MAGMKKIKKLKAGYKPPTGGGTGRRGGDGAHVTKRTIVGAESRTSPRVIGKVGPGLKGPTASTKRAPGPSGGSGARNAPTRSPGTPTRNPVGGFSGKTPGTPTRAPRPTGDRPLPRKSPTPGRRQLYKGS